MADSACIGMHTCVRNLFVHILFLWFTAILWNNKDVYMEKYVINFLNVYKLKLHCKYTIRSIGSIKHINWTAGPDILEPDVALKSGCSCNLIYTITCKLAFICMPKYLHNLFVTFWQTVNTVSHCSLPHNMMPPYSATFDPQNHNISCTLETACTNERTNGR